MKQTINFSAFCDAFRQMDRQDSFTYEGKKAIFEWIEFYEEDTGEEIELDVIAICCDFNELTTDEVIANYPGIDTDDKYTGEPITDSDDMDKVVEEYLNDNTTLIANNNGTFVFTSF
jgi:hypothetical protein